MEGAHFSGYATRANTKCSDGRTITPDAFKHQDTIQVPLVWQHNHDEPSNILGKAFLEHRSEDHPDGAGIYCYGFFNETPNGVLTHQLVDNQDVSKLSIYANQLVEKAKTVLHGAIQEVSVVINGANPGAYIENLGIRHSDGTVDTLDDEAIIVTGEIMHEDAAGESTASTTTTESSSSGSENEGGDDEDSLLDVYEEMPPKYKEVLHYMVGAAVEEAKGAAAESGSGGTATAVEHSGTGSDNSSSSSATGGDEGTDKTTTEGDLKHQEGDNNMTRNQFEKNGGGTLQHGNTTGGVMTGMDTSHRIEHDALAKIIETAWKPGGSFKEGVLAHAQEYGIQNIELLFPDAKALESTPQFIARRMEWVASVLSGTKHSPIAAVKTVFADITKEEARAKGYIKGNRKEEEVFSLLARSTRPATIYKKQKLDRDDMLDITDINVVSWLKAEMRLMIEEELARAILVGDNRPANHPDKIKDPKGAIDGVGIRSVLHDDDLYAIKTEMPSNVDSRNAVKQLVRAMDDYRGSGGATMYIGRAALTDIMLEDDRFGRPLYANRGEVADKVGVSSIVTVDIFSEYDGLFAIIVSLNDYTVGTNRGGELTSFEDFDIDFNQYKYLQETRLSGGLTRPFSAIVVTKANGTSVIPTAPSYDGETNEVTIPTKTGVVYLVDGAEQTNGSKFTVTEPTEVRAEARDGYFIPSGTTRAWYYQGA